MPNSHTYLDWGQGLDSYELQVRLRSHINLKPSESAIFYLCPSRVWGLSPLWRKVTVTRSLHRAAWFCKLPQAGQVQHTGTHCSLLRTVAGIKSISRLRFVYNDNYSTGKYWTDCIQHVCVKPVGLVKNSMQMLSQCAPMESSSSKWPPGSHCSHPDIGRRFGNLFCTRSSRLNRFLASWQVVSVRSRSPGWLIVSSPVCSVTVWSRKVNSAVGILIRLF
jgi:hypothetical protein